MGKLCRQLLAIALFSGIGFIALIPPGAATPPARQIYFVNLSAVGTIIGEHFDAEAAERIDKTIVSDIDDSPPLHNLYGEEFDAIYSQATLFASFRSLWSRDKNVDGFALFLGAINKAPAIRAMVATQDYSGCALVTFDLTVAHGRRYLDTKIAAHNFKGCLQGYGGNDFETSTRFPLD